MSSSALIGCSVTACILIVVALLTPGWFGLDIKTKDGDVSVSMNMFYVRVCAEIGEVHTCTAVSVSDAVSSKKLSMGDSERYTELMAEAVFALIGIVVGAICVVIFGASLTKRRDNMEGSSSNCLGTTGLVLSIIGGICGGILSIEFIIVHTRYDEVMSHISSDLELAEDNIEKYIPYSLITMCVGLFVEFIAVIVHIAALRTSYRAVPVNGIVLTPSVNAPSQVVVQHSTVSSTPYARFA